SDSPAGRHRPASHSRGSMPMASFRRRGKVWYYRFTDANNDTVERRGCIDKRATEAMARAAETEVANIRAGLVDPRAERILVEGRRPITEHVDDFVTSLRAAGRNTQHVDQTARYVREILDLARVERLPDLTPSRVVAGIEAFKVKGIIPPNVKH